MKTSLDEEAVKKLIQVGRVAKRAVDLAVKLVKPGVSINYVATTIENYIREQGCIPAFPVNIGINSVAAHYTPIYNDNSTIPEQGVVKIDVGVHLDGYIADTATSVALSPVFEGLVEASRKALEKVLEIIRPGIKALEIGKVIESTIRSYGFNPIKNLSGHGIERYTIHSGVVIPNYGDILARHRLIGGVYAIEPFATNGAGFVKELDIATIYSLRHAKTTLRGGTMVFYERVYRERLTLPFTLRWYASSVDEYNSLLKTIEELAERKLLVKYPVLVEKTGGYVSQHEHTIIITEKDVIVTTV
ncbi:MAG: type II methionyl aminopeptidase [Desulfurococcaceae archaeon]|nr:type II methionyl aminopeptidase [Desulfurococcaceae archaeon]